MFSYPVTFAHGVFANVSDVHTVGELVLVPADL